jgi:ABC-type antimicrobial peptide transport system permease subunit
MGLIGSILLGHVISTLLVGGVKPTDGSTFVAMTVGFLFIAALASWLPARRASILYPAKALCER